MGKGRLLTINLNRVSPLSYNGWNGELSDTDTDAGNIQLALHNFEITELKDSTASISNVIHAIYDLAQETKAGDLAVIYYSGHGAESYDTVQEENGFNFDQAWCLFDGLFKDNQVKQCLSFFKKGTRVVLISDSCHSGSMYKSGIIQNNYIIKAIPKTVQGNLTPTNEAITILMQLKAASKIECALKYFGGCQENQYSFSTGSGGLFTKAFLKTLFSNPNHPYYTLYKKLLAEMPQNQTPSYYNNKKSDKLFDTKKAFWV